MQDWESSTQPVILTDFQTNNLPNQSVRLSDPPVRLGECLQGLTRFKLLSQFEFIKLSVIHSYLDVLAEEVGIETQPVSGNVEPALQKDISEQSTGVH